MMFAVLLLAAVVHGSEYVTYVPGNMPLVITAPHGGYMNPEEFPERSIDTDAVTSKKYCGYSTDDGTCVYDHQYDGAGACQPGICKVVYLADSFTSEIASGLAARIETLTQKKPYLVKLEIRRNKVDGNRDKEQATFGDPKAGEVYDEYMDTINTAKSSIGAQGLLLDIHGMTHAHGKVELGYAIRGPELDCGFDCFNVSDLSIRGLVERSCNDLACAEEILRGAKSLGHFLFEQGYPVMPSPNTTSPNGEKYYSGGYTTRTFGSSEQGQFDAIQIESPRHLRFDDDLRPSYVDGLASAIVSFMELHYGLILSSGDTTNASRESTDASRDSTDVSRESTDASRESTDASRESTDASRDSPPSASRAHGDVMPVERPLAVCCMTMLYLYGSFSRG